MKTRLPKSILFARLICGLIVSSQGVFLPSIQWTPDNPLIQNLKGKVRNVRSRDGLNIWCPKDYSQAVKTQGQVLPSNLYFALYKVETKEEYDQCDATKGEQLLVCNDPEGKTTSDKEDILLYFTERSLSQDRGVYIPGNTYYYIGTSGGKHKTLDNKIGGKCSSHHMKLAIYFCKEDEKDCNVDVTDGGWSMWYENHLTGMCERNCTNPEPQNGGSPCRGPSAVNCSQVIINRNKETRAELKTTSEQPTEPTEPTKATKAKESTRENTNTKSPAQPTPEHADSNDNMPAKSTSTTEDPRKGPLKEDDTNGITLSMKGIVLIIMGMLILGCTIGTVLVLLVLHMRSKRSSKQTELRAHPSAV